MIKNFIKILLLLFFINTYSFSDLLVKDNCINKKNNYLCINSETKLEELYKKLELNFINNFDTNSYLKNKFVDLNQDSIFGLNLEIEKDLTLIYKYIKYTKEQNKENDLKIYFLYFNFLEKIEIKYNLNLFKIKYYTLDKFKSTIDKEFYKKDKLLILKDKINKEYLNYTFINYSNLFNKYFSHINNDIIKKESDKIFLNIINIEEKYFNDVEYLEKNNIEEFRLKEKEKQEVLFKLYNKNKFEYYFDQFIIFIGSFFDFESINTIVVKKVIENNLYDSLELYENTILNLKRNYLPFNHELNQKVKESADRFYNQFYQDLN